MAAMEQTAKAVQKTAPEVKPESKSNQNVHLQGWAERQKPNMETGVTQAENIPGKRENLENSKVLEIPWSHGLLYMGYLRFGDHNISK